MEDYFLNGDKKGKGKEYYDNNELKFEGEYLNGKRHGNGKEYDYGNGKLIFEGVYFKGEKWSGKAYNKYNEIEYKRWKRKNKRI